MRPKTSDKQSVNIDHVYYTVYSIHTLPHAQNIGQTFQVSQPSILYLCISRKHSFFLSQTLNLSLCISLSISLYFFISLSLSLSLPLSFSPSLSLLSFPLSLSPSLSPSHSFCLSLYFPLSLTHTFPPSFPPSFPLSFSLYSDIAPYLYPLFPLSNFTEQFINIGNELKDWLAARI